jgi:NAD(P)-dependent dehydrogenase (short-subunit alcohol dehydrogenase family)
MGKRDGKVAIVSGAGRGIGAEIARKLAADGAAVVVNDLDEGPAKETAAAIAAAGGRATECAGRVTEAGFAERFTRTAVDSSGGLDVIVNNAGYTWDPVIQKMTDEQWDAIVDVAAVYLSCIPESGYVSAQTLVCGGGFSADGRRT